MNSFRPIHATILGLTALLAGTGAAPPTAPVTTKVATIPPVSGERLRYAVNWPSGLSLGELDISASRTSGDTGKMGQLSVDANLDASLPGFRIADQYRSKANGDFCSTEFDKTIKHGNKTNSETTTFNVKNETLTRETKDGGKSDVTTPRCAKDALAFLYFLRNELANGRLPQQQLVFFGAAYKVRLDFGGARKIKAGGEMVDTDRITAAIHGPSSDLTVEIFFAHDAVRTPVLVRVPVSLGTLTAELMK